MVFALYIVACRLTSHRPDFKLEMITQNDTRASLNTEPVGFGELRVALTIFVVLALSPAIAHGQQGTGAGSAAGTGQSNASGDAGAAAAGQPDAGQLPGGQGATQSMSSTESTAVPQSTVSPQATAPPAGPGPNTPSQSGHAAPGSAAAPGARGKSALPEEQGNTTPQVAQEKVPYDNIPSLLGLYEQVPWAGNATQRFGSEIFAFGSGNANELPADIPVGPDFVLGAGDNVVLNLWGSQNNRLAETIDRQGEIALPEAGTIVLNGMTIAEAQKAIEAQLKTQFREEHVEISLGRIHSVRIYVVGDVQRPGAYDVSALSSPLSALVAAGGPTSRGSLRILRQYRGEKLVRQIDLYDFLLKGVRSDAARLEAGDTLLVPPAGPEVTIEGMVHRPAIYELNGEQTLGQVLSMAGGVLATGSLKEIKVQRVAAHQHRTMLDLQLSANPGQVQQQLADFKVQGGDDVVIAQILPFTDNQVFLEGHVYRPGSYPYREGMTIADLLPSSQVLLPEPSDHVELVRLVPPDYHPETLPLNLHDILIGNTQIALQSFDLVRVYGRYQFDAPTVSIEGEVLRPGTYPMGEGMTATELLNMAGGFTRSAYRQEADLSSYQVVNGRRVEVKDAEVALEDAADGDRGDDVKLQSGDVLSVRQLSGWQDIGATVSVNGEVGHPGVYSITPGERLSDVLRRAGGMRPEAYAPAAVLERVQVRELEEAARQQMIFRVENTPIDVHPGVLNGTAVEMEQTLEQQRARTLASLRSAPVDGRLVIHISADVSRWENTAADIELRAGDTLRIPKRPDFVMVAGQVFNPEAISYIPGRDVRWYLERGGGPTHMGDDKVMYVVHADGSVTPRKGRWDTAFYRMRMRPGDTIFVPEKLLGGSQAWQAISAATQIMYATALPLAIAGVF